MPRLRKKPISKGPHFLGTGRASVLSVPIVPRKRVAKRPATVRVACTAVFTINSGLDDARAIVPDLFHNGRLRLLTEDGIPLVLEIKR